LAKERAAAPKTRGRVSRNRALRDLVKAGDSRLADTQSAFQSFVKT